jgi:hypothetical protein
MAETTSTDSLIDYSTFTENCDIEIECEDGKILNFSRFALSTASLYFKTMLNGTMKESREKRIKMAKSSDCMNAILNYISRIHNHMCGSVINHTNISDIFHAADEFDLKGLRLECETFMVRNIERFGAVQLLNIAHKYSLGNIIKALHRNAKVTESLNKAEDIGKLNYKALIMANNCIPLTIKWLEANEDNKQHIHKLDWIEKALQKAPEDHTAGKIFAIIKHSTDDVWARRMYEVHVEDTIL